MKNAVSDAALCGWPGGITATGCGAASWTWRQIGARDDGGVCRHALSDEDIEARALLISWAKQKPATR